MNVIDGKIENEKNELTNNVLVVVCVCVIVAVLASIYRSVDIGWHIVMNFHIGFLIGTFIVTYYRKRIPFDFKVYFLLVITSVAALSGLLAFGVMGSNQVFLLALPIIACTFMSMRAGIGFAVLSALVIIVIGVVVSQNGWKYKVDPTIYLYSFFKAHTLTMF